VHRVCGVGLYIHDHPSLRDVWFDKGKGDDEKRVFRRTFTQGNVRDCIEKHDERLAEVYDDLYQRTIDAGAHPNDLALSGSMKIEDDPARDRIHIQQLYLHSDGLPNRFRLENDRADRHLQPASVPADF
jgi:hypothetical protein